MFLNNCFGILYYFSILSWYVTAGQIVSSSNYNAICENECEKRGENYYWCETPEGWDYCSPRPQQDINGNRCLSTCDTVHNGQEYKYHWCYTDADNNWNYCSTVRPASRATKTSIFGRPCITDCELTGKSYFSCLTSQGSDYCSPWPCVDYRGNECLSQCEKFGQNYTWCRTANEKKMSYCTSDGFTSEKQRRETCPNQVTQFRQTENVYNDQIAAQSITHPLLKTNSLPGMPDLDKIPAAYPLDKIQPSLQLCTKQKIVDLKNSPTASQLYHALGNMQIKKKIVIFITHGFRNTISTGWMIEMKDAILAQENGDDYLVVLVGWEGGANLLPFKYTQAVANTQVVGEWLSRMAATIPQFFNMYYDEPLPQPFLWGIGHSLGAHVMGCAGRTSGVFDRITGLDPAGPSFETVFQNHRLKSSDAKTGGTVDVIHTDGYDPPFYRRGKPPVPEEDEFHSEDLLNFVNHFGTLVPTGTHDFYPNWGYLQPATWWPDLTNIFASLSHSRAYDFFTWSILNPKKFQTNLALAQVPDIGKPVHKAISANAIAEMGFHLKPGTPRNSYVLSTNRQAPWK